MELKCIVLLVFLKIIKMENRMIRYDASLKLPPVFVSKANQMESPIMESVESEKVIGLEDHDDEYESNEDAGNERESKVQQCAIVVLSSSQDPAMQTLLRRYRYDSKGVLIPGSVKYFVKLPKGVQASPVLVPVNDKAFSPQGGFIRYYKEVPPIPHSF